jgi:hypothetical protein
VNFSFLNNVAFVSCVFGRDSKKFISSDCIYKMPSAFKLSNVHIILILSRTYTYALLSDM